MGGLLGIACTVLSVEGAVNSSDFHHRVLRDHRGFEGRKEGAPAKSGGASATPTYLSAPP